MVSVCTCHRAYLLHVVSDTETLACETVLCYVTAPSYGIAIVYGVVDNLAVVLYLNSKLAPHWVVGVAGDGYVIIEVQTEALAESIWSILLALVCELLWSLADV